MTFEHRSQILLQLAPMGVLLGGLLISLFGCDSGQIEPDGGSPAKQLARAPGSRVRLFDSLAEAAGEVEESRLALEVVRPSSVGLGPPSSNLLWLELPWSPADMFDESGQDRTADSVELFAPSSLSSALASSQRSLTRSFERFFAEGMERNDQAKVRDQNTLASRIALPSAASLSQELPLYPAGASAVVIARADGPEDATVKLKVLRGAVLLEEFEVTDQWAPYVFEWPKTLQREEAVLRCAIEADELSQSRLVIQRLDMHSHQKDVLILEGERNELKLLAESHSSNELKLRYSPRPPTAVHSITLTSAPSSHLLYLHPGPVFLQGVTDAVDDLTLSSSWGEPLPSTAEKGFRKYQIAQPGLYVCSAALNAGVTPVELRVLQPAAAFRELKRKTAVPEPVYGEQNQPFLQRIELSKQRRVAHTMAPPETRTFTIAADMPRTLRFAVASFSDQGEGLGEVLVEVSFKSATGTSHSILQESLESLQGKSWRELQADLPSGAGELSFVFQGEPFSIRGAKLRATFVALAEPVLVDPTQRPAGVIVYLIDTLRADHLQIYGYSRDTSPNLVEMESEFSIFENAYSNCSWTRPSTASLLTGLHPSLHGAFENNPLASDVITLAERFHQGGYSTAAFVTNTNVSAPKLGFEEGFEEFRAVFEEGQDIFGTYSHQFHGQVADWLARHSGEPFFLYVHSIDPHTPYAPPEEEWKRYDEEYLGTLNGTHGKEGSFLDCENPSEEDLEHIKALYDAEIRMNDQSIADLIGQIKELGLWDQTTFVLTSDHGEEFKEHGGWEHGGRMFQEQIRIPMLFRPAQNVPWKAGRLSHRAQLTDIAPTLHELAGLPGKFVGSGESLLPVLTGKSEGDPERRLYFDELPNLHALMAGPFKLVVHKQGDKIRQMFDLQEDSEELGSIIDQRSKAADSFEAEMDRWFEKFENAGLYMIKGGGRLDHMDQATIDALMEMGYIK